MFNWLKRIALPLYLDALRSQEAHVAALEKELKTYRSRKPLTDDELLHCVVQAEMRGFPVNNHVDFERGVRYAEKRLGITSADGYATATAATLRRKKP